MIAAYGGCEDDEMSVFAVILMVVGGGMTLVGFFGLFALMIEPLYSMFMIIFKREDDYVYYETKPGKELLQRNIKSLRGSCLFLLIMGIICFGVGWFIRFGPRGTDSLLSKQVESGAFTGEDDVNRLDRQVVNAEGNYVDAEGNEHSRYLIIRGTNITYKKEFDGSLEEFMGFVESMDSKHEIFLVDDFASAHTYHKVEELLSSYGFNYEKEGE